MSKYINFPYPLCNNHHIYCIEIWYDDIPEYYYFNSFQEAKEQYLFWTNDKYFKKIYFKKE